MPQLSDRLLEVAQARHLVEKLANVRVHQSPLLLIAGAMRLWSDRRLLAVAGHGRAFVAFTLFGMAGFQLFDGIVNHLILRLHPVREGVASTLPYDLAWNGFAILILLVGWLVWRQFKDEENRQAPGAAREAQSPDRAA